MDDEFIGQAFAELIESTGVALGIVVSAIAEQIDAGKLAKDIQQRLHASNRQDAFPPLAERLATHALNGALAVAARQKNQSH